LRALFSAPSAGVEGIPYDEVTDPAWNQVAASTWKGTVRPSGVSANHVASEGPCPRCGDMSTEKTSLEIHPGFGAPPKDEEAVAPPVPLPVLPIVEGEFTFDCHCTKDHEGQEEGQNGCGAAWRMVIQYDGSAEDETSARFFAGRELADARRRRELDEVEKLNETELTRVQTAADKWKTGLAGLIGLVATVIVVKGRESFTDLSNARQDLIMGLIAGAFLAAVWAALLAMRAAYGPLKRRSLMGTTLDEIRNVEVGSALRNLRLARGLSVFAALALASAVGVTWTGKKATPGLISVTKNDDTVVCGTLKTADVSMILIETQAGVSEPVPLVDTKTVNFVLEC
jgi:hypothetical protein